MTPLIKHTHKLKAVTYKSGNRTFFCTLDCTFKINPALALGKKSICWRCGEEFPLSEYSIRLVKPHCDKCHKPKSANGKETFIPVRPSPTSIIDNMSLADRLQKEINERQIEEEEL